MRLPVSNALKQMLLTLDTLVCIVYASDICFTAIGLHAILLNRFFESDRCISEVQVLSGQYIPGRRSCAQNCFHGS